MSEFKFNIVGKDGKIIEDLMFDDIDAVADYMFCLLYTSPSPRDATLSRMPSSA